VLSILASLATALVRAVPFICCGYRWALSYVAGKAKDSFPSLYAWRIHAITWFACTFILGFSALSHLSLSACPAYFSRVASASVSAGACCLLASDAARRVMSRGFGGAGRWFHETNVTGGVFAGAATKNAAMAGCIAFRGGGETSRPAAVTCCGALCAVTCCSA
jgi:hypothetical protein